ncbi:MAG TPA: pilus assembly protein PilM [Candidatus Paceibacterota bacterium]|jgi:type IV pilus assembly protein PilM|nr:pilus assembly protein PilM [Candidatus Paceibacterota bacterium]
MQSALSKSAAGASHAFSRMFPTPKFLLPNAAGIDISDASIKWIALSDAPAGKRKVEAWGQETLQDGVVSSGAIRDEARLTEALRAVRKKMPHIAGVHASLPEESAFVFSMSVPPGSTREQIFSLIEFEFEQRVPIPPSAAFYDFDHIPRQEGEPPEIGVGVFPRELAEGYARCLSEAGFLLYSLELEPRAIARSVVSEREQHAVTLLVDFGGKRSGLAVLNRGIPIFTSTVDIGVDSMDRALSGQLHLSPQDLETWRNEQGLVPSDAEKKGLEALSGVASALGSEVAKHFNYWDTRRNELGERVTPVSKVLLVGGGANLKGLGDYIAGRVQAEVIRPNVWSNVCSFEEYIPPIERRVSLQYATAIGLALR